VKCYPLPYNSILALVDQYLKITILNWVLEVHAYNPSYSGSRNQEDHGLKPAQENSSRKPISKIPSIKKDRWSGLTSMRT
jgi:hypothetical protein